MRKWIMGVACAALVAVVAACSGGSAQQTTAAQRAGEAALAACTLYSASVRALVPYAGWLTANPDKARIVEEVRTVLSGPPPGRTGGLCTGATPAEGVAAVIMSQVTRLLTVQTSAQDASPAARAR